MRKLLFSALLVFAVSTAFAQEKAPAGSRERGYQAYMKYRCDACHGTIGQGGDRGVGPKLAPNPMSYEAFAKQTRRPREVMPAYREPFLSEQDLADIYAYMLSIKPSPAPKDISLLDF